MNNPLLLFILLNISKIFTIKLSLKENNPKEMVLEV